MTKFRTLILTLILICLPATSIHAQQDTLFGTRVTVEGTVSEIVSEYGFILDGVRPFDITPDRMLVFPETSEGFVIDINEGMTIQVTGTIDEFSRANVEALTDYTLNEESYRPYSTNDYQVVADFVVDIETFTYIEPTDVDVDFINGIQTDPSAYYEQNVTLDGTVVSILSPSAFVIRDTQPFVLAQDIVIFDDDVPGFGIDVNVGSRVQIGGVFYPFDLPLLDSVTTYNINATDFNNVTVDNYAIIASQVISARQPVTNAESTSGNIDTSPENAESSDSNTDTDATSTAPQPISMDVIEDNPLRYVGESVIISGEVERIFSSTSFLLEEQEFFDLNPLQIIAFSESAVGFPVIVEDGMLVEVTGRLYTYNSPELIEPLQYELDTTLYDNYDDTTLAIIIDEIEVIAEPSIIR